MVACRGGTIYQLSAVNQVLAHTLAPLSGTILLPPLLSLPSKKPSPSLIPGDKLERLPGGANHTISRQREAPSFYRSRGPGIDSTNATCQTPFHPARDWSQAPPALSIQSTTTLLPESFGAPLGNGIFIRTQPGPQWLQIPQFILLLIA